MMKARFTQARIMGVLRQTETGAPVSALCCDRGMSSAMVYKWRAISSKMVGPLQQKRLASGADLGKKTAGGVSAL